RLYQRIAREDGEAWWRRLWPRRFSWRPVAPAAVACAAVIAAFLLKSPLRAPDAASHNEPKLQIEQVEHALDDMEMLKQLSVDNSVEPAQSREKI
ncbi:MAG TPA: hypothetical protein VKT29_18115, partial [Terriglobales bacterium]|nr:hypothetical protein [Terriglobales bacterium]